MLSLLSVHVLMIVAQDRSQIPAMFPHRYPATGTVHPNTCHVMTATPDNRVDMLRIQHIRLLLERTLAAGRHSQGWMNNKYVNRTNNNALSGLQPALFISK